MTDNTPRPELSEDQIANLAYLRIKIKHLAVEPEIIRKEHFKRRRHAVRHNYHYSKWLEVRTRVHRLAHIRPEARAALLAYGFIRGKAYHRVELPKKKDGTINLRSMPIVRVAELVLRYGDLPKDTTKKQAIELVGIWVNLGLEDLVAA
jgi:hypothetical protein